MVAATSEASFLSDEVMSAAVLHHLTVIGEAISRLSVPVRERHPEVPWRHVIAERHRIVHAYFDLDWQILWDATSSQLSFPGPEPIDSFQFGLLAYNGPPTLDAFRNFPMCSTAKR